MNARDLVSKILAAGLSAGLFLIWWPEHHPTTGLGSLILRGALWTLAFELLLLAFAPLERLVARAVRERVTVRRIAVPPPARIGGACVLACVGAALPLALLSGAHAPRPARAAAPKPRRVVVVKHLRQKVVVREVVTVPGAPLPVVPRATPAKAAPRRTATKPKPKPQTKPKTVAEKPATQTTPAPVPGTTTATTPEPAPAVELSSP